MVPAWLFGILGAAAIALGAMVVWQAIVIARLEAELGALRGIVNAPSWQSPWSGPMLGRSVSRLENQAQEGETP